jgi:5'-deoxynucleotidase YfbR-like HD superfamily hydrolase
MKTDKGLDMKLALDAGQVTRYHAEPQMNKMCQTNADHSWGVAVIIMCVFQSAPSELLRAALLHDLGERKCGDDPAQFKREFPELAAEKRKAESVFLKRITGDLPELDEFEQKVLKFADLIEACVYICNYAKNPSKVGGWTGALLALSEVTHWLDKNSINSEKQPFYNWVCKNVHPIFTEVDESFQITPF